MIEVIVLGFSALLFLLSFVVVIVMLLNTMSVDKKVFADHRKMGGRVDPTSLPSIRCAQFTPRDL